MYHPSFFMYKLTVSFEPLQRGENEAVGDLNPKAHRAVQRGDWLGPYIGPFQLRVE